MVMTKGFINGDMGTKVLPVNFFKMFLLIHQGGQILTHQPKEEKQAHLLH